MKNKEKRIEELKEEIEEDMSDKLEKLVQRELIGLFVAVLFMFIRSSVSIFGSEFQTIMSILAASAATVTIKEATKQALGIKYDKKSLKHLEKVENEGIKKNERLDKKRQNKINELSREIKKSKKKVIIEEVLEVLLLAGVCITSIPSFIFPRLLGVALASLTSLAAIGIKKTFDEKELHELMLRCENLENDLYLGEFFATSDEHQDKEKIKVETETRSNEHEKVHEERYIDYKEKDKPKVYEKKIK